LVPHRFQRAVSEPYDCGGRRHSGRWGLNPTGPNALKSGGTIRAERTRSQRMRYVGSTWPESARSRCLSCGDIIVDTVSQKPISGTSPTTFPTMIQTPALPGTGSPKVNVSWNASLCMTTTILFPTNSKESLTTASRLPDGPVSQRAVRPLRRRPAREILRKRPLTVHKQTGAPASPGPSSALLHRLLATISAAGQPRADTRRNHGHDVLPLAHFHAFTAVELAGTCR
jgi:hypothetical protein